MGGGRRGPTHVWSRNHVLDGDQGRTNLFAAARGLQVGDAAFSQNSLTTYYYYHHHHFSSLTGMSMDLRDMRRLIVPVL